MRVRSALLALMMALMPPLGALNAWVPALAHTAPHNIESTTQSSAQSPRTCRSGFLPGAGCAKFLDLGAHFTTTAVQAASPVVQHVRLLRMQDQPAPPKGPPRTA